MLFTNIIGYAPLVERTKRRPPARDPASAARKKLCREREQDGLAVLSLVVTMHDLAAALLACQPKLDLDDWQAVEMAVARLLDAFMVRWIGHDGMRPVTKPLKRAQVAAHGTKYLPACSRRSSPRR
jgi:hypothetical protein